ELLAAWARPAGLPGFAWMRGAFRRGDAAHVLRHATRSRSGRREAAVRLGRGLAHERRAHAYDRQWTSGLGDRACAARRWTGPARRRSVAEPRPSRAIAPRGSSRHGDETGPDPTWIGARVAGARPRPAITAVESPA